MTTVQVAGEIWGASVDVASGEEEVIEIPAGWGNAEHVTIISDADIMAAFNADAIPEDGALEFLGGEAWAFHLNATKVVVTTDAETAHVRVVFLKDDLRYER